MESQSAAIMLAVLAALFHGANAQVSIGFENTAYSFAENDTAAQVCVKVTGDLQANVQVSYETANDTANNTATAGEDYTYTAGVLEFSSDTLQHCVNISISTENVAENSVEKFTVSLTDSTVNLIPSVTTVFLSNCVPATLVIQQTEYSIDEDEGDVTVCVELLFLDSQFEGTVLDIFAVDDSAESPDDFTSLSTTITFPADSIEGDSQCVSISIHDDSDLEDPEEFKISLSSGDNTVYIDIESAVVEIRDNDGNDNATCPDLMNPPNGEVVVTGNSVGDNATFSCNSGHVLVGAASVITCQDDGQWSGPPCVCKIIFVVVSFDPTVYTVIEGLDGFVVLTLVRSGDISESTTVTVIIESGSALAGPDYIALTPMLVTFTSGEATASVNVLIVDDSSIESSEMFTATVTTTESNVMIGNDTANITILDVDAIMCLNLVNPANGMVVVTGNSVGDTATYTCDPGFELEGAPTRTCQSDGTWSGIPPVCESTIVFLVDMEKTQYSVDEDEGSVVVCAELVATGGFLQDIVVNFVTETDSAESPDDFTSVSTSLIFSAGSSPAPSIKSQADSDSCVDAGFDACCDSGCSVGNCFCDTACHSFDDCCDDIQQTCPRFRECMSIYIISDGVPEPDPEQFTVSLSTDNVLVSIEEETAVVVIFEAIMCLNLVNPANGMVVVTGNSVGDTATYTCDPGFELEGAPTRTCQSDGTWSGQPSTCDSIIVEVSFVPTVYTVTEGVDGFVDLMLVRIGDISGVTTVTVTTKPTTAMAGSDYSHTMITTIFAPQQTDASVSVLITDDSIIEPTEIFSATLSATQPHVIIGAATATVTILDDDACSDLAAPLYGSVSVDGTTTGSTASYSCDYGYELVGDVMRVCMSDLEWSGTSPVCLPILCPNLVNPANGMVVVTGNSVGDNATYTCDPGFELEGATTRTCQSDGTWSGIPPWCESTIVFLVDMEKTQYSVDEDEGSVVVCAELVATGGFLQDIVVNFVTETDSAESPDDFTSVSTSLIFSAGSSPAPSIKSQADSDSCVDAGFDACCDSDCSVGNCYCDAACHFFKDCCHDIQQTCPRFKECMSIYIISDGVPEPDPEQFTVSLSTDNVLVSIEEETAVVIIFEACSDLAAPLYGSVSVDGTTTGSTASYSCDDGYELVGDVMRVCMSDSEWSGTPPVCLPIMCPNLVIPANGMVAMTGNLVGDTATYTCDPGFELVGNATQTCLSDGTWSDIPPVCIMCPNLVNPANGMVVVAGMSVGDIATYTCDPGFELEGVTTQTCQSDGTWSGIPPWCESTIVFLVDMEKTQYSVDEDEGSVVVCAELVATGGFLQDIVVNFVTETDSAESPDDFTSVSTSLIFSAGSSPAPSIKSQADSDSCVDAGFDACCDSDCSVGNCYCDAACHFFKDCCHDIQQTCPRFKECVSIYIISDGVPEPDPEQFTVSLSTDNVLVSIEEETAVVVIFEACSDLAAPLYGSVTVDGTTTGSTASYSCDDGYELVGEVMRVCMSDSEWSGTPPVCLPIMCLNLVNPANGMVAMTGNSVGDTATYTCDPGFELVGNATQTCLSDGTWSDIPPVCIMCPNLVNPANGMVVVAGMSVGDIATYTCDPGFELEGVTTRTCQSDGTWSGIPPWCESTIVFLVDMEKTQYSVDEDEGSVVVCAELVATGGFLQDIVVNFVTETDSAESPDDFTSVSTSLIFSAGSSPAPSIKSQADSDSCVDAGFDACCDSDCSVGNCYCDAACHFFKDCCHDIQQTCPRFRECVSIYIISDGVPEPDPEQFTVSLSTDNVLVSIEEETAVVVIFEACSDLAAPQNGSVSVDGTTTGSTASYSCDIGFELVGEVMRVCMSDSEWSGTPPVCRPLCPDPLGPAFCNATFCNATLTGYSVGDNITYNCNPGFETEGAETITCQSDGMWSDNPPACKSTLAFIVDMEQTEYSVDEDEGSVVVCAELVATGGFLQDIVVNFVTETDSAESPDDFTSVSTSLIFSAGSSPAPSVKSQLDVSDSCVDAGFDACCDSGCSVGNCFCDMACHSFDDCCDDIQQTCPRFRECVSIYIISDGVPEPDPEQFTVNLSTDNVLVSIEKKAAVVFIFEEVVIGFEDTLYTTLESEAVTVCLAVISGGLATGEVIAVNYNSSDNTATDERAPDNSTTADYFAVEGIAIVSANLYRFCFNVTILDDDIREMTEDFIINCELITDADADTDRVVLSPNSTTVLIVDNDNRRKVSDIIIGDPLLYVALLTTSLPQVPIELEDPVGVCYQIHGKSGNYFNLLTHSCMSVNAHWVAVTSSLNIIDQIAVRAVSKSLPPMCHTILVNLEGCSVSINDNTPVITNGKLLDNGGVVVKRKDNMVKIKVPNCSDQKLVMRVECENRTVFNSGSEEVVEMIKFNVTRDLNVENGQAHGMIGQFYYHKVQIQHYTGPVNNAAAADGTLYTIEILEGSSDEPSRTFIGIFYEFSWMRQHNPCFYAGNSQAGSSPEVLSFSDSVIAGTIEDYIVPGPFSEVGYKFGLFNSSLCEQVPS